MTIVTLKSSPSVKDTPIVKAGNWYIRKDTVGLPGLYVLAHCGLGYVLVNATGSYWAHPSKDITDAFAGAEAGFSLVHNVEIVTR